MENLNKLVDRLIGLFLHAAGRNQSSFVNHVPRDLRVCNESGFVSNVVYRMLGTIVNHVKNSNIRITAKKESHMLVLEILESGSENGFAMASDLQEVSSFAESTGGSLNISLPTAKMTSIAFRFPVVNGQL